MKKATLLTGAFFALTVLFTGATEAQEELPSRIEVGIQFSSITLPPQSPRDFVLSFPIDINPGHTEAGLGGRITLNLNKHMALEAEANFFPHENFVDDVRAGTLWQGHFGLKVGKRFGKFGFFGKARPGFASFSKTLQQVGTETALDFNGQPTSFPVLGQKRKTHFAMDLGGVIEFYPSRRVLARIDVGDTIIHYGSDSFVSFFGITDPQTNHNLQVSAGVGFRFGSLPPEEKTTSSTRNDKLQKFEVGAQFSSLALRRVEHNSLAPRFASPDFRDIITQAGFGGRFTVNLTPSFALEAQGDFYPDGNLFFINNGRVGGRFLQLQAGLKTGKRFEKFGIFAKVRPGAVSFSRTIETDFVAHNPAREVRKTYFSMDVGGVLEFYPTRRIVTRFDGGDTMIFYRSLQAPFILFPLRTLAAPAEVLHNFQFSAGVGFRF